jgi:hypothetical protein
MRAAAAVGADELLSSPAWLPLEPIGADAVRLVHLDEDAYRRASFLDQRLFLLGYPQTLCPRALLEAAAARLALPSHYIFHTGHVGSTLISRLIGEHERCFALREPALLRTLATGAATAGAAVSLEVLLALLGRTWRSGQLAVIKATSFVSELAETLLAAAERPAALMVFAQPHAYLCNVLAGPNSRAESRQLAAARVQRLTRRLGEGAWRTQLRSEGEYVAMSWLCEMSALEQAAARFERQVLWVDFDAFLGEPGAALQAIFRALGADPAAEEIEALVAGPIMRQYSKAPEHAYNAALRRELLESAKREHAVEIRRGMDWLRDVARGHPQVASLLAARERMP